MRPLSAILAAEPCRQQPVLMHAHGGALCARCGREVAVACERHWLNDVWDENGPGETVGPAEYRFPDNGRVV